MAVIFSGLALKPSRVTTTPRNFPSSTPKEHFFGFNFMLYFLSRWKVSSMSANICFSSLLFITRSST
ncbi:hypothetical protein Hanom_Chr09g00803861 [Helianthus anomalus]